MSMLQKPDIEDTEKFFDPIRGEVEDASCIPWLCEEHQATPAFSFKEIFGVEVVTERVESLSRQNPWLFAAMGGFRA